jgi:glycosyltransferase involved in cell wall biosynthesis
MKFVLVSTHVDQTTGYAKVVINLLKQLTTLAPAVKTYHFGFQRHPKRESIRKVPSGVIAYDAAANEDPREEGFGFNKIHEYLEMVNPDVVMIYNDPLIIHKFIEAMKYKKDESPYKLWLYVDQVYEGIAQPLIDSLNKNAHRIYCFTESWSKTYAKYGPSPELNIMEHAVDSTVFRRIPEITRQSVRARMNVGPEAIIMMNANRNSSRKRQDLSIMGFVELIKRHPLEPYYLLFVTSLNVQQGAYYDLARIYQTELRRQGLVVDDFGKRMMIVDTGDNNAKAMTDDIINDLYNACNIGLNTSDGEGFGLCQIEHLYTGAPQIVTDVGGYRSFMDESVTDFIAPSGRTYMAGSMPLGFWAPTFTAESVADAMESAIRNLPAKELAAVRYSFKTWDTVCAGFLKDVKAESGSKSS